MHVARSDENLSNRDMCTICRTRLRQGEDIFKTACAHFFHRMCLLTWLKKNSSCPECRSACDSREVGVRSSTRLKGKDITQGPRTTLSPKAPINTDTPAEILAAPPAERRRSTNNLIQEVVNLDDRPSTSQAANDRNNINVENSQQSTETEEHRIHSIVSAIVAARTEATAKAIESKITSVIEQKIEKTIEALMSKFQINNNRPNADRIEEHFSSHRQDFLIDSPHIPRDSDRYHDSSDTEHTGRTNLQSSLNNLSRVTQIISAWEIKFDGTSKVSVENFIYRIESLTFDTLGGNFTLVCENLHTLFAGEAKNWYWRYRKNVNRITWTGICHALRVDFGNRKSDYEIKEELRTIKQGPTECFDSYKNSVLKVAEDLHQPIPDSELVEILLRGLRPRLRQQLLYVPINGSMEMLRKYCLKGESFMQEMSKITPSNQNWTSKGYQGPRKTVAVIENYHDLEMSDIEEEKLSINEIAQRRKLICWNCREEGHRYVDCVKSRSVFCYGCGAKGVYKPNCTQCNAGNSRKSEANTGKPRED